ncbi:hypothetical protein BaRGS_00033277 [Batillaria attramentaria]|uniref:Hexosyltransferase n=1 Tax=Batillaria attramentaria TaxID=370345 RepID=A0ABD0JKZ3_9CAEN
MLKLVLILLGLPLLVLYVFQPPSCDEEFFTPRKETQLSLDYDYVHDAKGLCGGTSNGYDVYTGPDVVILVMTMSKNKAQRQAIRDTYGTVSRGEAWPGTARQGEDGDPTDRQTGTARVVFLMGQTKDVLYKATEAETLAAESREYGDVVQWDGLVEDYSNLTLKVLLGLRWVRDFCPQAHHIVKTDDDVFIHLPRLLRYLERQISTELESLELHAQSFSDKTLQKFDGILQKQAMSDVIHGAWLGGGVVLRNGKYVNSEDVYPHRVYPLNVKGALYVLPAALAVRMLAVAEYFPYNNLEDVHVTGTLACAVGARHVGFSMTQLDFCDTNPKPCDFADGVRIASRDVTPELFREMWLTFSQPDACSSFFSGLLFTPGFLRLPKCVLLPR